MKTLVKIKCKEIVNMPFEGIEFVEIIESSGDDVKGIAIRDKKTGAELHLRMNYSDLSAYTIKPKEYEDKFALSATLDKVPVNAFFDTEEQAKSFADEKGLINIVIKPTKVEKV